MTRKQWQYRQFLKTPFWREMSAMKRRMVTCCERCPSRRELQCHHKVYRAEWTDTRMEDLEVVCRTCHEKEHGRHDPKQEAWSDIFWCCEGLRQIIHRRIERGLPLRRCHRKKFRQAMRMHPDNGGIELQYTRMRLMHDAVLLARSKGITGYDATHLAMIAIRPTICHP